MLKMITEVANFGVSIDKPNAKEEISGDNYQSKRDELIKKDKSTYFTVDVPFLTDKEKQVEKMLFELRDRVVQGDQTPLKLEFYDGKKIVETSKIYQAIFKMPKGAHLHLHTSAAMPLDVVLGFTKEDFVYYSFDENKLKAAPNGIIEQGYQK